MNGEPEPEALYRALEPFATDGPHGEPWAPGKAVYRGDHWAVIKFPQKFELAVPEDLNRRTQEAILERLTGPAASSAEMAATADPWWTDWRVETAEKYRDAVRWLRRNDRPSVAGAARRMRAGGSTIDRDTLTDWIEKGKLEPPADVPER